MHTTGAAAKTATVIFFMLMSGMIISLYCGRLQIIGTAIGFCTGYTRQNQKIKTEYENDYLHAAKLMVI